MSTSSDPPSAPASAPAPPPDDLMLSISQLAKLWSVSDKCIYQWRDAERLPCLRPGERGRWSATAREARAAKVISQSDVNRHLEQRRVHPVSLELAKRIGAVQPELWPPTKRPRYSLDDIETIARIDAEETLKRQAAQEALVQADPVPQDAAEITSDAAPGPSVALVVYDEGSTADGVEARPAEVAEDEAERPSSGAVPSERRDRHRAVLDYLERSLRPCDMPAWFWMGPSCPPFVAPTGVFRYEFSATRFDPETASFATAVRRSGGHKLIHGKLTFVPADATWRWLSGLHRVGACPRGLELTNQAYDLALEEWWAEYRRHGGPMALLDSGRGDREAAIRRYVASEQSPADLPAWFWDTEQMPPFVPPFETFFVACGEQFVNDESDETMTWLTRSEGWEETWLEGDDAPSLQPRPRLERMFPIEGAHAPGTVPEQFVVTNWRYLVAKEAWEAQWHRHRRLCEAAIAAIKTVNKSG